MSKQFSTTIVQRKDKSFKATLPFEFDEDGDASEDSAVAIPSTIHLIPIGQWEHDAYGPIIINASDIREYQQNFNAGIRKGVFITAGHEGMSELPAVGWVKSVEGRDNGLWGEVEWNELGKEALSDKQFKFFSPEMYRDYEDPESHQFFRNVLTGGALTKSPYFKELESIVFSDKNIKNNFNKTNNNMTPEEKAKMKDIQAKKTEELTAADKAFLKKHKEEMSDEEVTKYKEFFDEEGTTETEEEKTAREAKEKADAEAKEVADKAEADAVAAKASEDAKALEDANIAAGLNADGTKIEASEKKMVQITASELAILRTKADEGQQAFKELEKNKLDVAVKGLVFSESNKAGKFLPKSEASLRAFMATLNVAQKATFSTLLQELPKTQIFSEIGSKEADGEGTATAEVEAKVTEKMVASEKSGKVMKYSEALKEVMSENDGLEKRYDLECKPEAKKN